ncbi:hypothetical protein CRYUN_Cryun12cG0040100 [Craigia yunnanensis]
MDVVVGVIPNHILQLHTTRSWDFLGFSQSSVGAKLEGDVVIGLLDTGIWPEHESLNSQQLGAPPSKWKGTCQGANFTCNSKIIGGRYYNSENSYFETDFKSPRDSEGHGTHTFSIAADILAAFDDAIADGVDEISVSLGVDLPLAYDEDPIVIGTFHAMKYGILTSNSTGNSGPWPHSVSSYAPWTLTVAASPIDRKFVAKAVLGNGQVFTGLSINNFELHGKSYPLIWGGDAANYSAGASPDLSRYCITGFLNSYKVEGKIVYCETLWDGTGVLLANGVGTIMADDEITDFAFNFPLPATQISTSDGEIFFDYIKSTENPTVTILLGETWTDYMAPYVVSFSSRGPNPITPEILKVLKGWNAFNLRLSTACFFFSSEIVPDLSIMQMKQITLTSSDSKVTIPQLTVTNVGSPNSTYTALMSLQPGFNITVEPQVLSFSALGENKSFTVKVSGPDISLQPIISGNIIWQDSDYKYLVRSPAVVYNVLLVPITTPSLKRNRHSNVLPCIPRTESLEETKNHFRI